MPRWNEDEGLWELTEAEEKAKTHPGLAHVLTREERSRGGQNGTGHVKRRSPDFYSALNAARGRKGAAIRWGKPIPPASGAMRQV